MMAHYHRITARCQATETFCRSLSICLSEKGMKRTSVFERLGAESKADTTTGSKPTGVFSRLGRGDEEEDEEEGAETQAARRAGEEDGAEEEESDGEGSVLQYAGVLKRPPPSLKRAPASSSQPAPAKNAPVTLRRLGSKAKAPPCPSPPSTTAASSSPDRAPPPKPSILQRLGKVPPAQAPGPAPAPQPPDTQDSRVTSTRPRALASSKVSSSTSGGADCGGAQMDNAGAVSVFKRLGTKRT
ncbi:hypothetical protein JZ751_017145 [Albula glossodonta]|uniref:DUF5577 domain-containing protein n=1 Tax=Albula glossodonta TaxID=121402 RepID=A0A8T2NP61_9TELE|nr:hypothetical protein JZ751_017145 [Albula glossodonta]